MVIWGRKWGCFWNVNWVLVIQLATSSSGPRGSPCSALERNCSQLGDQCTVLRGVNPIFHHHSLISHHPPTWFVSFYMNCVNFNKEYHCNKKGAKRSSTCPDTPFWPISLKKQQKGCQNGWKTKFNQIWFSALKTTPRHVRSTFVVFWGEKKPWLGCCGPKREFSVPKFELRFCPGHWGRPFCLKFCEPSSHIIWTWFAPKNSHSRTCV